MSRTTIAAIAFLGLAYAAPADDKLSQAYSAILQGDIAGGKTEVERVLASGSNQQALQAKSWLSQFHEKTESRDELRDKTYAWNVDQARHALAGDQTYLALSFAAQATAYAADDDQLAGESLAPELRDAAMREAKRFQDQELWSKAHSIYFLLTRIFPHDEQLKTLRQNAERHARLEALYDSKDAVKRRTKDVDANLLFESLRRVDENYYEKPDFKVMAEGALLNLMALCETHKLNDVFDGVANPATREHFLSKIELERQNLQKADKFDRKTLLALYRSMKEANRLTIELPEPLLIIEFLEGALSKLDDFTSVVWPADSNEFDKMMVGGFSGVGIQLGIDETTSRLQVVTPLEGSPALDAGIEPEDLIVGVDDQSTKGWSTEDAIRQITGPEGTKVTLKMFRPSTGEHASYTLTRRRIQLRSVRGIERMPGSADKWNYMLDPAAGVAYVQLTGFNPESGHELKDALKQANDQGMKGLVLDLRNNPGGLLDVAVETVGAFLAGERVVETKGRREERQKLDTADKSEFPDLPLVVMINEHSASASEILAGALQDHGRALILGDRSFGKGSVQRVLPIGEDARLKLTTALYYLPNGRSPHKALNAENWGVDPDVHVKLTPKEVAKILEHQRNAAVIHKEKKNEKMVDADARKKELDDLKDSPKDEDSSPLLSDDDVQALRADPFKAPDFDPQLETALLQLRVKLAANLPWPHRLAANTTTKVGDAEKR
ncbi:MAG: S41 family peptidase [Phycisphaerae bacterium]